MPNRTLVISVMLTILVIASVVGISLVFPGGKPIGFDDIIIGVFFLGMLLKLIRRLLCRN
jgi:hypothetical protein